MVGTRDDRCITSSLMDKSLERFELIRPHDLYVLNAPLQKKIL